MGIFPLLIWKTSTQMNNNYHSNLFSLLFIILLDFFSHYLWSTLELFLVKSLDVPELYTKVYFFITLFLAKSLDVPELCTKKFSFFFAFCKIVGFTRALYKKNFNLFFYSAKSLDVPELCTKNFYFFFFLNKYSKFIILLDFRSFEMLHKISYLKFYKPKF